jgi:hypothetical protein
MNWIWRFVSPQECAFRPSLEPVESNPRYIYMTKSVAQEIEGSSPQSQKLATGPYPEPIEFNPHPQPISQRSIVIPSSYLRLGLPSGLFPSGFPTKTLYTFLCYPMRATCPVHLTRLDLICLMISEELYLLYSRLINFKSILQLTPYSNKWSLTFWFGLTSSIHFAPPRACYILHPSSLSWFDSHNKSLRRLQVIQCLVT